MNVTWHAFSLREGRRGPQVHTKTQGAARRAIGEASDGDLEVYVVDNYGRQMPSWQAATQPGASTLVALDELEQPIWEGMVLRRDRTPDSTVAVALSTLEAYFDRRYVSDQTYTQTDQALIAQGLIAGIATDGVSFTIDAPLSGIVRDRVYTGDSDKTVLSVLQELSGVIGGPEFTIDLRWKVGSDRQVLERVLRVRNRLGVAPTYPTAQFTFPGNVTTFTYSEDYTSDAGANDVLATSSGEGDVRPTSAHHRPISLGGRPLFEYRFTPSTDITDTDTLDGHAEEELQHRANGLAQLDLTARLDSSPIPGRDWYLGDDVAVSLTAASFPEIVDSDGFASPGYVNNVRAEAWEIDFEARTLTPSLVEYVPVDATTVVDDPGTEEGAQ